MFRSMLLGGAILGALALPAGAQAPIPPGPRIAITAITQPLPTQPQYTRVDQPLIRDGLRTASNGRIEVTLATHAERNLAGTEIVRLVRSGQAEIGAGTLTTLSGDVPILDGIDLSGLAPDITLARRIADAMVPVANRDMERFGTRIIATYPFPAQVVFCRQPFTSLADLRGRRIRTFGNSLVDFFNALGAQPTSIGFPEVYSALERGVVDCAITGSGSGAAARWPEVSTHISDMPVSWAVAAYIVNVSWLNRQEPAVRELIERTFREVSDRQWALGAEATRDGIDCNIGNREACRIHQLAARPMTEVKATEADRAETRRIFEQVVLPGWVRRCGARCGEVYNQVIAPLNGIRFGG
ncbi:TRAP transporter substrate-binding protein [Sabulicella glaciei]|uniref:TRAP transporter substrate-binding protein n=1 Tax=Sabulicella glaciei TaxID=2984948 RepID=A0ABT3NS67_9PROT|nr:TRAP transporter substrate-binding protein [Roseococcus sp. MDT2-1-1]MCW8084992.1 TRAP transporter substrate-binding protein [Roseococcus sp. MDT2-1-1]